MKSVSTTSSHEPWNKGKIVGQKAPFKLREVWVIRIRLQMEKRTRELALFGLMLDSFTSRGATQLCTQKFSERTLKESDQELAAALCLQTCRRAGRVERPRKAKPLLVRAASGLCERHHRRDDRFIERRVRRH